MPTPRTPRSGSQGTKSSPLSTADQAATDPTYTAGSLGSQTTGQGSTLGGNGGSTGYGSSAGSTTSGIYDRVRQQASSQVNAQKERAAAGIGSFAQAMRQTGDQLRGQNEVLAGYVDSAVEQLQRLSDRIREKDPAEFVDDLNEFARRRPAMFVGTAFLLGVGLARFLKSSSGMTYDTNTDLDTRYGSGYNTSTNMGLGSDMGGSSGIAHDIG